MDFQHHPSEKPLHVETQNPIFSSYFSEEEQDDDEEEDDEEDSHPEIVDCTKDDNDNGSVETKVVSEGGMDEAGTKRTLDGRADNGAKKARLAMTLNEVEKRGAV